MIILGVLREESTSSQRMVVYLGMLQSVKDVLSLLECLDHCKLCTENNDEKFLELVAWRQGKFMDKSGRT